MGFNFSAVFGFFEPGDFEVSNPTKNEICEVVLKTELSERTIWTVETGAASDSLPSVADTPAEFNACGVYIIGTR